MTDLTTSNKSYPLVVPDAHANSRLTTIPLDQRNVGAFHYGKSITRDVQEPTVTSQFRQNITKTDESFTEQVPNKSNITLISPSYFSGFGKSIMPGTQVSPVTANSPLKISHGELEQVSQTVIPNMHPRDAQKVPQPQSIQLSQNGVSVTENLVNPLSRMYRQIGRQISQPITSQNSKQIPQPITSMNYRQIPQPITSMNYRQIPQPITSQNSKQIPRPITPMNYRQIPQPITSQNSKQIPQPITSQNSKQIPQPITYQNSKQIPQTIISQNSKQIPRPTTSINYRQIPQPITHQKSQQIPRPITYQKSQQIPRPITYQNSKQIPQPITSMNHRQINQQVGRQIDEPFSIQYNERMGQQKSIQYTQEINQRVAAEINKQIPKIASQQITRKVSNKIPDQVTREILPQVPIRLTKDDERPVDKQFSPIMGLQLNKQVRQTAKVNPTVGVTPTVKITQQVVHPTVINQEVLNEKMINTDEIRLLDGSDERALGPRNIKQRNMPTPGMNKTLIINRPIKIDGTNRVNTPVMINKHQSEANELSTENIGHQRDEQNVLMEILQKSPGDIIDEDTIIENSTKLDRVNLESLLRFLGDNYHNDEGIVSDEIYDELVDIYEAKYGTYKVVGAEPTGMKVKLPYYLGSLRKIKKDKELEKWLESYPGPYIVEDKIDGLTLLLVCTSELGHIVTRLYTRGGGYNGLDVSHLLEYIRLPHVYQDIVIRGEVVMTKETFSRIGGGFKNARNLVSGIINSKKKFNPVLARELAFYAYRIVDKQMTPEEDIDQLTKLGFKVPNPVAASTLTREVLENYLKIRKSQAPYEMDGLVIYQNKIGEYPEGETPRHVVAFKTGTETVVTTVTNVLWRASKDKLLKPVVNYETVNLSGADLNRATGYNARFIVYNHIGPGAKILITRSGDVIPKILSVITPAPDGPAYPDPSLYGNYEWNVNGVEFVVTDENPEVIAQKLWHFISKIDIKGIGPERTRLLAQAGIKDINGLLNITQEQLIDVPGIGPQLSYQLYTELHEKIGHISGPKIMAASGFFPNIGEKRFETIFSAHPNFIDQAYENPDVIETIIRKIPGFDTLAGKIAIKMGAFLDWLRSNPMINIERKQVTNTIPKRSNGPTVVFSGFRDSNLDPYLEQRIKDIGGKVTTSVSRNTNFVIMANIADKRSKAIKAEKLGIPLISKEEFIQRYLQ